MSNDRITFVPSDGTLAVNNDFLLDIPSEYFSWVSDDVHAFQWYGDEIGGEIEFKQSNPFVEKKPNERVLELGEWSKLISLHSEEKQRRHDSLVAEEEAFEASRDYWGEFRHIRDLKLQSCDWTQLSDAPITQEQKSLWEIYRQELRDLPENIVDPKPLVYSYLAGESHPDWPIPPN